MSSSEHIAPAVLIKARRKIPAEVRYSTRFSILVKFLDGALYADNTDFDNLTLTLHNKGVKLGPCRFTIEPNIDGFSGRLVFTEHVYDYHELFYKQKRWALQNSFLNLPFILEHKKQIHQKFMDYTSDLTYDLSVYKNMFDTLDEEYRDESPGVRDSIQRAIMDTEGTTFLDYFEDRLQELGRLVADYAPEEYERHGFYFRRQVWSYIMTSAIMRRTNLKPRGYSGDSEMMRMIYQKEELGDTTFSKLMHKHPVECPAAQAVRNRRVLIAQTLEKTRQENPLKGGERFTVLSVACGPSFELHDLLKSPGDCDLYNFTLLDQDSTALHEAAILVDGIEKKLHTKVKVEYLRDSVRTMLTTHQLASKWGDFHFVYSMGLFDYLTPPVAKAVLTNLYQLLKPGGEMIIGNFHITNPSRFYMEYWNDWVLYYRTEEDLQSLLQRAPQAEQLVLFEDTGCQMFLRIRKPQGE
jgi:SAM-dependent methyltransferase